MNFIINEVVKFKHINTADSDAILKGQTGSAIAKYSFAIRVQAGKFNGVKDIGISGAVKNGRSNEQI